MRDRVNANNYELAGVRRAHLNQLCADIIRWGHEMQTNSGLEAINTFLTREQENPLFHVVDNIVVPRKETEGHVKRGMRRMHTILSRFFIADRTQMELKNQLVELTADRAFQEEIAKYADTMDAIETAQQLLDLVENFCDDHRYIIQYVKNVTNERYSKYISQTYQNIEEWYFYILNTNCLFHINSFISLEEQTPTFRQETNQQIVNNLPIVSPLGNHILVDNVLTINWTVGLRAKKLNTINESLTAIETTVNNNRRSFAERVVPEVVEANPQMTDLVETIQFFVTDIDNVCRGLRARINPIIELHRQFFHHHNQPG